MTWPIVAALAMSALAFAISLFSYIRAVRCERLLEACREDVFADMHVELVEGEPIRADVYDAEDATIDRRKLSRSAGK